MKADALKDLRRMEGSFREYASWTGPDAFNHISWDLVFKGYHERLAAILTGLGSTPLPSDTRCRCGHSQETHGMPTGQVCLEQIHFNVWCECDGFEEKI